MSTGHCADHHPPTSNLHSTLHYLRCAGSLLLLLLLLFTHTDISPPPLVDSSSDVIEVLNQHIQVLYISGVYND